MAFHGFVPDRSEAEKGQKEESGKGMRWKEDP